MYNYYIFIVVWSAWGIVLAALSLAFVLGRAFRQPLPSPAIDSAELAGAAPSVHVLSYAPAKVRHSAIRKRPWLAGIPAIIELLVLLSVPLAPAIVIWAINGMFQQFAYSAMAVGVVTMVLAGVLMWRGLRQTNGVPAAVNWPRRKLLLYSIGGIFVCGLTLLVLDRGTKHRLQRMREEMDAQSMSLYVPVPSGTPNAADVYRQAFALIAKADPQSKLRDWSSRYASSDVPPTAPPALSADLDKAVILLHRASELPVADWGINPKSYTINTHLPHLAQLHSISAPLLRIHAAKEAREGRIDSAIRAIHAIHAIARHAGQGQILVEGLVATGIDGVSYASTEDVLPFITDERLLDQLIVRPDDAYQKLRSQMFRGEQAFVLRSMADIYDGTTGVLSSTGTTVVERSFHLARVFVAESDVSAARRQFDEIVAISAQNPNQCLSQLRQHDAQFKAHRWNGGWLTGLLMPSVSRTAARTMEMELLGQLNNVGLAARRMYLRTGRLPATLDDLVSAGLLKQIPVDPFSGQPILMKGRDQEVVIYSVGLDGVDNGGDVHGKDVTFRVGIKPLWEIDLAIQQSLENAADTGK